MENNVETISWQEQPPTADYLRSLTLEEYKQELGRQLAFARRQVEGVCEVCGTPFVGTTKRIYCSNRCAVRAHRQNKKGDQN